MFVIIVDKYKSYNYIIDNHFAYKDIEIIKKQNDYFLYLHNELCINEGIKELKIKYSNYKIIDKKDMSIINLYIYKDNIGIDEYNLYEAHDFIIANHAKANIQSKNEYADNYYLLYKDGYIKTNYEYLSYNGKKYNNEKIQNDDYIYFFGTHIIFYDEFLYINHFRINIFINKKEIKERKVKFNKEKIKIKNYYEQDVKELTINKLKKVELPKFQKNRSLIFQIGPSITMSLGMLLIAGINIYTSNSSRINYATIIMPSIMLMSSLLWPLLYNKSEKRKFNKEYKKSKQSYIEYLKEYEKQMINDIDNHKRKLKEFYFDQYSIKEKLFYITKNSYHFLEISLGHYTKAITIEDYETVDVDINENISRIKYRLNNIDDYPLFISLLEKRRISIICNINDIDYYIKRCILELAYKYSNEDINIIIYTKNSNLIFDVNNIPHLFNKGIRQIITQEYDLSNINSVSFSKNTVIICDELLSFDVTNSDVSLIYFSSNDRNILKNSDAIIYYTYNEGKLIEKQNTIYFNYEKEDIRFSEYFEYISKYTEYELVKIDKTFLDLFPSINVLDNYTKKQESLEAIFSINNDRSLQFDLHESKDGPHGLIGGSTGSGKSELIVSMLLSLALKYRPDYLNIILIDYKGGGIKDSLSYHKKYIPHIVASVDNLQTDTFERLIIAISKECQRRQNLFKQLSSASMLSIMSIDDYHNNYINYNLPMISHLLIVVDEFAELKKENPEIIKELISFSRIGRSLGIHLILATQKPSGIIDDEIWSNSHFKIALKVQNEKDSLDIIKCKESAYLNKPGEFYLKVDDRLIKAKAVYSKTDINDNFKKEVSLLNNKLEISLSKVVKNKTPLMESSYLIEKILLASESLRIKTECINFDKPNPLSIEEVQNKYSINNKIIFGEIDDYLFYRKDALAYPLNENIFIYSNRNNEINNILTQLALLCKNTIVISHKIYSGKNIIASILYENNDDINYLIRKLLNENCHDICLVVEDYALLASYSDEYNGQFNKLIKRSNIKNISVILLTKQSSINFRLLNDIKNKLIIDSKDNQDILNIYSSKSMYKGNSFFFDEKVIPFVPCIIGEYINDGSSKIDFLDRIPDTVKYEKIKGKILIGYDRKKRTKIYLDDSEKLLITGYDEEELEIFKNIYINDKNIIIKKYDHSLVKERIDNYLWVKNGLDIQKLFYCEKKEDFDGYYLYKGDRGRIIKAVNHE